jgi:hypothetical protein
MRTRRGGDRVKNQQAEGEQRGHEGRETRGERRIRFDSTDGGATGVWSACNLVGPGRDVAPHFRRLYRPERDLRRRRRVDHSVPRGRAAGSSGGAENSPGRARGGPLSSHRSLRRSQHEHLGLWTEREAAPPLGSRLGEQSSAPPRPSAVAA